jgi:hypothetical protein
MPGLFPAIIFWETGTELFKIKKPGIFPGKPGQSKPLRIDEAIPSHLTPPHGCMVQYLIKYKVTFISSFCMQ